MRIEDDDDDDDDTFMSEIYTYYISNLNNNIKRMIISVGSRGGRNGGYSIVDDISAKDEKEEDGFIFKLFS